MIYFPGHSKQHYLNESKSCERIFILIRFKTARPTLFTPSILNPNFPYQDLKLAHQWEIPYLKFSYTARPPPSLIMLSSFSIEIFMQLLIQSLHFNVNSCPVQNWGNIFPSYVVYLEFLKKVLSESCCVCRDWHVCVQFS